MPSTNRNKSSSKQSRTLDRVGMPELAVLLKKSIAVLGGHLPKGVLSILPRAEMQKAAKRRPSDDQIESGMDPIDAAFNRMELSAFPTFDKYIKEHPEEFIHGDNAHAARQISPSEFRPRAQVRPGPAR